MPNRSQIGVRMVMSRGVLSCLREHSFKFIAACEQSRLKNLAKPLGSFAGQT